MSYEEEYIEIVSSFHSSFISFLQFFFKALNGREFKISKPIGRESHHISISKELELCCWRPSRRLIINVPPGYGKSTMLSFWTAWTLSRFPHSQYLYVSYSKMLATQHTETIRRIVQLPEYRELFNIQVRHDARGKELFKTNGGATIAAAGASGTITGLSAGLPDMSEFSGAMIMDDMHKPDEVHSDTLRQKVIQNFKETLSQRPRGINVPQIMIAQRLHESDVCDFLLEGGDGHEWEKCVLQAMDNADNALYPEKDTKKALLIKQEVDIYTYASQYQQNPQPAGGALYKKDMFRVLDAHPDFLTTFITCDTAETSKSYNDATVFSLWGLYQVESMGHMMSEYALHSIDCYEIRVEPKELKDEFMGFWSRTQSCKTPPRMVAIEKKSTGVTLLSVLSDFAGLEVRNIDRNVSSSSKSQRFLWLQPYVASKLISFTHGAKHYDMCVKQAIKITANDTHAFDDIIDTLYDAVKIALIDKTLILPFKRKEKNASLKSFGNQIAAARVAKNKAYGYGNYR